MEANWSRDHIHLRDVRVLEICENKAQYSTIDMKQEYQICLNR